MQPTPGSWFAYNPASHLIWWVGGLICVVLAVIAVTDLVDRLRDRLAARRDPLPEPDAAAAYHLPPRDPSTELRHRHYRHSEPTGRTWREGRPNDPFDEDD